MPLRTDTRGFALPTILISATVMLFVLLAAVQVSVSTNLAIDNQYIDKLGRAAAESGVVKAQNCIAENGTVTWSNATPLRPNTDCTGTNIVGLTCANTGSDSAGCYVVKDTNYRSSFVVYISGPDIVIDSRGIVSTVKKTSGQEIGRASYSLKFDTTDNRFY